LAPVRSRKWLVFAGLHPAGPAFKMETPLPHARSREGGLVWRQIFGSDQRRNYGDQIAQVSVWGDGFVSPGWALLQPDQRRSIILHRHANVATFAIDAAKSNFAADVFVGVIAVAAGIEIARAMPIFEAETE
jgi:hypothetical protein